MDVLIIDDDHQVRKTLGKMLEQAGFMVTDVDNGLAALAALREQTYRAILCDVQMDFLEGPRFYDELRAEQPDLVNRIVFVTGNAGEPTVRAFLAETGRPVVSKPVDAAGLVRVVREVVDRHR